MLEAVTRDLRPWLAVAGLAIGVGVRPHSMPSEAISCSTFCRAAISCDRMSTRASVYSAWQFGRRRQYTGGLGLRGGMWQAPWRVASPDPGSTWDCRLAFAAHQMNVRSTCGKRTP